MRETTHCRDEKGSGVQNAANTVAAVPDSASFSQAMSRGPRSGVVGGGQCSYQSTSTCTTCFTSFSRNITVVLQVSVPLPV